MTQSLGDKLRKETKKVKDKIKAKELREEKMTQSLGDKLRKKTDRAKDKIRAKESGEEVRKKQKEREQAQEHAQTIINRLPIELASAANKGITTVCVFDDMASTSTYFWTIVAEIGNFCAANGLKTKVEEHPPFGSDSYPFHRTLSICWD